MQGGNGKGFDARWPGPSIVSSRFCSHRRVTRTNGSAGLRRRSFRIYNRYGSPVPGENCRRLRQQKVGFWCVNMATLVCAAKTVPVCPDVGHGGESPPKSANRQSSVECYAVKLSALMVRGCPTSRGKIVTMQVLLVQPPGSLPRANRSWIMV